MAAKPLRCPKCQSPLLGATQPGGDMQPCAACGTLLSVEVFPAMFRRAESGSAGELVTQERESACFYHPQKKAVEHCAACGRYVCSLCDCVLRGEHYCPSCLESGKRKGKIVDLDNERMLYGNLVLTIAIVPLLCWYFTIITAPIALWMAFRHWRSPPSLVQGRQRTRLVVAAAVAVLEILLWIVFAVVLYNEYRAESQTSSSTVTYEVSP